MASQVRTGENQLILCRSPLTAYPGSLQEFDEQAADLFGLFFRNRVARPIDQMDVQ